MSETGSALRATSDALLADLQVLESLEREKRQLTPGHPRLLELAAEVEEIAHRLLGRTVRQRELSAAAHEQTEVAHDTGPRASIDGTVREIHLILADWRDAERRGGEAEPGSAEEATARAHAERLRKEYRQAHELASRRR